MSQRSNPNPPVGLGPARPGPGPRLDRRRLPSLAGKVAWLDEVVQEVLDRGPSRGQVGPRRRGDGRDEGRRPAVRPRGRRGARNPRPNGRTTWPASAHRAESPSDAILQSRFNRLLSPEARDGPDLLRAQVGREEGRRRDGRGRAVNSPASYPNQAEAMVRKLGTEGLAAVRVYGDDVAEVVVKDGPDVLGVLRKTGRGGLDRSSRNTVLPNKKQARRRRRPRRLPGRPRQVRRHRRQGHRVRRPEFAKAGVQIASAVTPGPLAGWRSRSATALAAYGLDFAVLRYLGMGAGGPGDRRGGSRSCSSCRSASARSLARPDGLLAASQAGHLAP